MEVSILGKIFLEFVNTRGLKGYSSYQERRTSEFQLGGDLDLASFQKGQRAVLPLLWFWHDIGAHDCAPGMVCDLGEQGLGSVIDFLSSDMQIEQPQRQSRRYP